jgi:prepilin-type N-terminal cleavage/methylation domain-containing protein
MKIPRTKKRLTLQELAFTLIELLVVIGIIALLASIAVPAFTGVQIRAAQTKAMSNAKQIGLACKQFAIDNNGAYPTYAWSTSGTGTTAATNSNVVFDNLFPTYLTTISLFYVPKSAWTPGNQPADPPAATMQAGTSLPAGTNEWAYVTGLYDTSNSAFPLLADGFSALGPPAVYTTTETAKGGVWKGQQAIVIFCDDSAKVMKTNSSYGINGGPQNDDLFNVTETGWMGSGQTVQNPL